MLHEFITSIINWYMLNINYGTVGILMAMESTIIPFPSELIVPPAAWKAAQGELNIYLVIAVSSVGALCGSLVNYFVSRTLGRPILYAFARSKWARIFLLNEHHLEKAENYFKKYGNVSTFIGRLLPVIRHLISIPAGLSRMNLKKFCLFTFLGATIWNIILSLVGVFLYSQREVLEHYYKYITNGVLVVCVLVAMYLAFMWIKAAIKANAKA